MTNPIKIIRLNELIKISGMSRSTIYLKLNDPASDIPRPVKLGTRAIGWVESEIQDWLGRIVLTARV